MNKRFASFAALGLSSVLMLTACGNDGGSGLAEGPEEEEGAGGGEINIALIPWEEDIAATNMWKVLLEEKGYDVTVTDLDVAPVFQGAANGDVDLFLDTWLPVTHADYWDEYGDQLEDLGAWYDNAKLTLTVPTYMEDVNSIEDLPDVAGDLDNRIVGIESGSGLVRVTKEEAMPGYGLDEDFELIESSTSAMLAELDSAYQEEEPIVVTLWRPHIAYSQYDLKDLEDPEGLMGDAETVHSIGREGFAEDFPEVAEWLGDFTMSDEELGALEVATLEDYEDDPEEGARVWLSENPEFVERTLGEAAEGVEF
ncbi:glycine betaine ABC transporter substrate-binding protein [Nocardiopsis aegyptia]|uniref:Glycine betaine/proline transport system substrate-binding protein n=1 Tax=Nocardiopsis aegyptia TaxID=220378 RepID=A0A7Z0EMI9_9ACTN|nr:glycine betaine ABC transporter substrate-binding protein [Nocardiopsis aegyptia]NYJ34868.1 glycine betaine/proline transport system substrate-binding protein [Nocardiopsis aegyptia]